MICPRSCKLAGGRAVTRSQGFGLQIQYLFDSTPSLPSFPLPTAALAPLYHHFHSFCLSSSLFLSFPAEFLQTLLEERQRMPLEEKEKGRSRTGSWRVEVRQLHCNSRRHHLHHGLCTWSPLELCSAQPGHLNAAIPIEVGNSVRLWSQDEVNAGGAGKP